MGWVGAVVWRGPGGVAGLGGPAVRLGGGYFWGGRMLGRTALIFCRHEGRIIFSFVICKIHRCVRLCGHLRGQDNSSSFNCRLMSAAADSRQTTTTTSLSFRRIKHQGKEQVRLTDQYRHINASATDSSAYV